MSKILVVEDEMFIAKDIKEKLENLGYQVPAICNCGEDVVQKTREIVPDLILMDVKLEGEMDGIQAAELVKENFHIPVIFLTAFEDDETLKRIKITEPFGYILKPFKQKELRNNIEIALYKHLLERKLKESEEWLAATLRSIADGVITTDIDGRVTFMNRAAESLTGWEKEEAAGKDIREVLRIEDEKTRGLYTEFVDRVLAQGSAQKRLHSLVLVTKDRKYRPISENGAPIINPQGKIIGGVFSVQDLSESRLAQKTILESEKRYLDLIESVPHGIFF